MNIEISEECTAAMMQLSKGLGVEVGVMIEGMFLKHLAERNVEIEMRGPSPMLFPEYMRDDKGPIRGKRLYEMLREMALRKERAEKI